MICGPVNIYLLKARWRMSLPQGCVRTDGSPEFYLASRVLLSSLQIRTNRPVLLASWTSFLTTKKIMQSHIYFRKERRSLHPSASSKQGYLPLYTKLIRASPSQGLDIPMDQGQTSALSSLLQWLTTCMAKTLFPLSPVSIFLQAGCGC